MAYRIFQLNVDEKYNWSQKIVYLHKLIIKSVCDINLS